MRTSEVARLLAIVTFFAGLVGGFVWILSFNEAPSRFNAVGGLLAVFLIPGAAVLFALSEISYRREPPEPVTPATTSTPPAGATGEVAAPAPSDLRSLRELEQGAYDQFIDRTRAGLEWAKGQIAFLRREVANHKQRADGMKSVAEAAVKGLEDARGRERALEARVAAAETRTREIAAENAELKRDAGIRHNPEGFDDETLTRLQDEIRRLTSGRA